MANADAERCHKPLEQATSNKRTALPGNWKTGNWKNETAIAYSYLDRGDFLNPKPQEPRSTTSIRNIWIAECAKRQAVQPPATRVPEPTLAEFGGESEPAQSHWHWHWGIGDWGGEPAALELKGRE